MTKVVFRKELPWALLPRKTKIDIDDATEKRRLYEGSFRWLRRARAPELCWPWRLAQEFGWLVPAPVDIEIAPFRHQEISDSADPSALRGVLGTAGEIWKRPGSVLWVENAPWLRLFDFSGKDARWESMFVPNGEGTVEWRLGWSVEIPKGHLLLVLPLGRPEGYEVISGLLDQKSLSRSVGSHGISIAIRPLERTFIRRGDDLARVAVLPKETMALEAEFVGV